MGAQIVWLTKHHFFDDGYLPQCWTLGAAIAARTEQIRIGTAVSQLPLHAAIETAEKVALVDIMSNGRVGPGFGVGYRRPEYEAFGSDFDLRYETFADGIQKLRTLWGEELGPCQQITPQPIQNPVPMWGGFRGPGGARTAGRLGLGLQWTDASLLAPYRAGLDEAGHDRSAKRMAEAVAFLLAADPERAWDQAREHVEYRWNSYNRHRVEDTAEPLPETVNGDERIASGRFVLGTVDAVVRTVDDRTQGLPVTDIMFWGDYPGMPDNLVDRHIELALSDLQTHLDSLRPTIRPARIADAT